MSEPPRQPDTGAARQDRPAPRGRFFQNQPIMLRVIYALVPIALAATYFFGLRVLEVLAVLAALAAVLMLVERRLVKFGTCVLDVNNAGRRIEVPQGGTVLGTLKSEGIFLPSACG